MLVTEDCLGGSGEDGDLRVGDLYATSCLAASKSPRAMVPASSTAARISGSSIVSGSSLALCSILAPPSAVIDIKGGGVLVRELC